MGIAIAAFILILGAIFWHGVHRVDPKALDAQIHQSLPPGTDKSRVIEFLNAQLIAHSAYDPDLQKIWAEIPKSSIGLFPAHINIVFTFDKDGKLATYKVQEMFEIL